MKGKEEKEAVKEEVEKPDPVQVKIKECCGAWNEFVGVVLKTKEFWDRYRMLRLESGVGLDAYPLEAQKILYLANPHGDFDLMIEDLVTHRDFEGFMKTMIIK